MNHIMLNRMPISKLFRNLCTQNVNSKIKLALKYNLNNHGEYNNLINSSIEIR